MDEDLKKINDILQKIENRLDKIEATLSISQKTTIGDNLPSPQQKKKLSAKEFLITKNPKSDIERTFYLGYYLEKLEMYDSFGIAELKDAFRAAKLPLPGNLSDNVNKNIMKGYFMEAGKKENGQKNWMLTATGESVMEEDKKNG
jgi:hypothetical protein